MDVGGVGAAALVVAQVMPPAEAHSAVLALEGLLALVDEDVGLELVRVAELGGAELAGVGTFAGVDAEVATEVRDLDELALAVAAVVGLFAGVEAHVRFQVVVARESGREDETLVWVSQLSCAKL